MKYHYKRYGYIYASGKVIRKRIIRLPYMHAGSVNEIPKALLHQCKRKIKIICLRYRFAGNKKCFAITGQSNPGHKAREFAFNFFPFRKFVTKGLAG